MPEFALVFAAARLRLGAFFFGEGGVLFLRFAGELAQVLQVEAVVAGEQFGDDAGVVREQARDFAFDAPVFRAVVQVGVVDMPVGVAHGVEVVFVQEAGEVVHVPFQGVAAKPFAFGKRGGKRVADRQERVLARRQLQEFGGKGFDFFAPAFGFAAVFADNPPFFVILFFFFSHVWLFSKFCVRIIAAFLRMDDRVLGRFFVLVTGLALFCCAQAQTLPAAVAEMMKKQGVQAEDVSILVQAVDAEQPLVALNEGVSRHPASVAKLLTTAAGLLRMGADYRWETRFYVDNLPDANGVVNGNLYIVGGGDPFLVQERFEAMVQDLRGLGLRHITGNIVMDNSLYRLSAEERDRESFDGAKWSAYNAVPDPLMVNFRTVKITIAPAGKGRAGLTMYPPVMNWQLKNQLKVNGGACGKNFAPHVKITRDDRGYAAVEISGTYSTACGPQELQVVMGEASEQFYYLFRDLWYAAGGSFDGGGQMAIRPSTAKHVHTAYSLPLSEQIAKMNQLSNNVMTRQLMLTLGTHTFGTPGSLESGRRALYDTLEAFGVPTGGMVVDNGAGLSRDTRVSAVQLMALLRNLYHSAQAEVFIRSLAVPGGEGTMQKRFVGEGLAGSVFGKTGTVNNVRSWAGYIRAASGRVYVLVMMGNGRSAVASRYMQDDLIRWIYKQ